MAIARAAWCWEIGIRRARRLEIRSV